MITFDHMNYCIHFYLSSAAIELSKNRCRGSFSLAAFGPSWPDPITNFWTPDGGLEGRKGPHSLEVSWIWKMVPFLDAPGPEPMQGSDPNPLEGSGPSNPYGFEGRKGCLERLGGENPPASTS